MFSKAENYMACQGEVIKIEVEGLPAGYTYAVYTQPTGGTYSYSSDPTFFLKTDNSDEVAYVQAISNGTSVGDRIEVPVLASAFCGGSTTDQSCSGTLLYNEDFGGNSTTDPNYSSSDANFTSDMDFVAGGIPGRGEYGILKHIPEDFQGFTPVTNNSDHTHPGNINQGYFMFIDPSDLSMGHTVAETTISNLCDNTELTFSFWASDMWSTSNADAFANANNNQQPSTPKFDMQLVNPANGKVLVLVPKIVVLGIEVSSRSDPEYSARSCREYIEKYHINPDAVVTVAVSALSKDSEAVRKIAEDLGCFVTYFDSRLLKAVRVPLNMGFTPERLDSDFCTAAACLASDNGRILMRRAGDRNSVIMTTSIKRSPVYLTH